MWLFFAFCSAALLGFYDVFKKYSLVDNAVIPVLLFNTFFCTLIFLPFVIISAMGGMGSKDLFYIPVGDWRMHQFIMIKAVIVLSSWICGYFGIKHLPLTIVGPINATRPVLVLLGAVLIFGERLNFWQWLGVLLAIFSFFLLSKSGRKEGICFFHNRWILFIVLAALFGAVSGLYDKYLLAPVDHGGIGLNKMMVQFWYNLYQFGLMLIVLITVWLPNRKKETPFRWKWSIILISLFLSMADFLYFYALSLPGALISIVSMVRRSSVLVSFCIGALIFHEHNIKSKAIDLVLVILSMIFLWLGTVS